MLDLENVIPKVSPQEVYGSVSGDILELDSAFFPLDILYLCKKDVVLVMVLLL